MFFQPNWIKTGFFIHFLVDFLILFSLIEFFSYSFFTIFFGECKFPVNSIHLDLYFDFLLGFIEFIFLDLIYFPSAIFYLLH